MQKTERHWNTRTQPMGLDFMKKIYFLTITLSLLLSIPLFSQQSIARRWNEMLLEAIRLDFARPTVHARNLYHTSIAMYDAWAVYGGKAKPFLLGNQIENYISTYEEIAQPENITSAREEAISYACYRLIKFRFKRAARYSGIVKSLNELMLELGLDTNYISANYQTGTPADMGNFIAQTIIDYGLQDGSNEANDYKSQFYKPSNPPLEMSEPGNPNILFPNRWQQLKLKLFIDQSGNILPITVRDFIGPEWGRVVPFALKTSDLKIYNRDNADYWVYHDPGPPPYLDSAMNSDFSEEYKWGFALVAAWSAHHDPTDDVMWDISPAGIGNLSKYPEDILGLRQFYNLMEGGDQSPGHRINPKTGSPYSEQLVPRGDYVRALSEFWADGPDSETPPGHWFTILNHVSDHPLFVRKFVGLGEALDPLEWDVKSYLTLGGAMHDAAITAWGIKGWYDYVRPVSAIRYMASKGQSSDPAAPSYHPSGMPLIPGRIELIYPGDILAGNNDQHVGKIKLRAWRGPNFIFNSETDVAGVGWILAENWWPYQRPTFVTPPFAGYISGHSTFSSAAAVVLTELTGDPYFPGGISEFEAAKNEFLVFENGPSVSLNLQWATYQDAADQCSLSRIWGGIHPPADDIPGRHIGRKIGKNAFELARSRFFEDELTFSAVDLQNTAGINIYPNPADDQVKIILKTGTFGSFALLNTDHRLLEEVQLNPEASEFTYYTNNIKPGMYFLIFRDKNGRLITVRKLIKI